MKRFKLLGLALMAVFALTAALSASAFALELPENLPASTTRTSTGVSNGITKFGAVGQEAPVECTSAPGEATETSSKPPSGAFHIKFEGCTTTASGITVKCTGLGDATGVILALGTWALVFDRKIGGTFEGLTSAILFKNETTHFTCGGLVLVEVNPGETLCLHIEPTVKKAKHEYRCEGTIEGKPITAVKPADEWGKDVGGALTGATVPKLTASVNHATPVAAILLGNGITTASAEIFADQ
jgi:hypothetical protein